MFGNTLKSIRNAKKISQSQLATAVFVTQSQVSKWEKGIIEPSLDKLIAIADYLSCTIDELLERENYGTGIVEVTGEILTEDEAQLLFVYRKLNHQNKNQTIGFAKGAFSNQ